MAAAQPNIVLFFVDDLGWSDLGYYNLLVGKWHLGHETYHPIHQGFDQQIGTSNWGHPKSYYPVYFKNSEVMAEETERYLTDKLTDETVTFIEEYDKDQPFMVSLWYYSVHGPHEGRKDWLKHFEAKGLTGRYAQYAAMVKSVDESVGRVRDALTKKESKTTPSSSFFRTRVATSKTRPTEAAH